MSAIIEVNYFNSYWIKRVVTGVQCKNITDQSGTSYTLTEDDGTFTWPGPYNNGDAITDVNSPISSTNSCSGLDSTDTRSMFQNWFVEEGRIRGGFNNVSTDLFVLQRC